MNILKTSLGSFIVNLVFEKVELTNTKTAQTFKVNQKQWKEMKRKGVLVQYNPELPGTVKPFTDWDLADLRTLRSDRLNSFKLHVKAKIKASKPKKTKTKPKSKTKQKPLPPTQTWNNIKHLEKVDRDYILKRLGLKVPEGF